MEHPQFGGADLFDALQRGARSISLWKLGAHPHGDALSVRKVVRNHPSTFDSSEAIAETLAHYIELRRTPETLNRLYRLYDSVTVEDVHAVAKKYFAAEGRTIVALTPKHP